MTEKEFGGWAVYYMIIGIFIGVFLIAIGSAIENTFYK